uniref:Inner membrane component domain-containing protein n=1 Tax=Mucochytrium quahogii TaxID=96639 RepID=A0A7S2S5Z4_9STRA|mmetsp:Transcript_8639/g.13999  ORF Transcript_8639/g.13999 Transcript_8639/m.13999 type:complete len:199 (+) Transcript_8639:173-769(+)
MNVKGSHGGPSYAVPIAQAPVGTETTIHTTETVFYEDDGQSVSFVFNVLWICFGSGAVIAAVYAVFGFLLCCTIVLAPFGLQLLKIAQLALFPFGKHVDSCSCENSCTAIIDIIMNVLWFPMGFVLLQLHIVMGISCALTCIGIPFAFQHLKLAQLALFPFGSANHNDYTSHVHTRTHVQRQTIYDDAPDYPRYGAVN